MEFVGSGLGHGVDQQSAEIPLTDVERRQQDLVLLDRVERNRLRVRLAAGLTGSAEAKEIAGGRAVDLDRVLANVDAAARDAARGVETCGTRLTKSAKLRLRVGSRRSNESPTVVPSRSCWD